MIPLFAYHLAFFALAALPVLLAIYFLQNRLRRHTVSSLILWTNMAKPQQGGLVINRIKTPLLLFLEILAIILLILAAASPLILSRQKADSYVFVLDDSFSMQAGKNDSSRDRAAREILKQLNTSDRFYAKFVLAAKSPQMLSQSCTDISQVRAALKTWTCLSPSSAIPDAIALGRRQDATSARMIVITDHPPDTDDVANRSNVEWWSFGSRLDNVAIVNASRTAAAKSSRCFYEVAAFTSAPVTATLTVEDANSNIIAAKPLTIDPAKPQQVLLEVNSDSAVKASIASDDLDFDNTVFLLAPSQRKVRVKIALQDQFLSDLIQRAINSVDFAAMTNRLPHIVIQDRPVSPDASDKSWHLCILSDPNSSAFVGPFVLDRTHPLCDGLLLDGVIWAASKEPSPGLTLAAAGNTPLMTESILAASSRIIYLNFNPRLSNLQQSPNFPVLIFNLLTYRRAALPQALETNVRLASDALVRLEPGQTSATVKDPAAGTFTLAAVDDLITFQPSIPGIYTVSTPSARYQLAAGPLAPAESDLSKCAAGKWGSPASYLAQNYISLALPLILLAALVLLLHGYLARRTV